jgi:hypothetical protein
MRVFAIVRAGSVGICAAVCVNSKQPICQVGIGGCGLIAIVISGFGGNGFICRWSVEAGT